MVMQICPWCMNEPKAPTDAAFSRSTSSMTISALFPPSSRCARLRWRPASSPTARPARVDPVNAIDANARMTTIASPGVSATRQHAEHSGRQTGFFEDAGKNHTATDRRARIRLEDHRIAQCQCGSDLHGSTRMIGKLNGAMTPTVPTGTRREKLSRGCSERSTSPTGCCAAKAAAL